MAEVLTEWPTIVRTRKAKYPWDEWTNGEIWKVSKGDDFDSEPKTFVQGLYAHAKRHGGKVKVGTLGEDAVVFSFSNPEGSSSATAPTADETNGAVQAEAQNSEDNEAAQPEHVAA